MDEEGFVALECSEVVDGFNGKPRRCGSSVFHLEANPDGRVRFVCGRCGHSKTFLVGKQVS